MFTFGSDIFWGRAGRLELILWVAGGWLWRVVRGVSARGEAWWCLAEGVRRLRGGGACPGYGGAASAARVLRRRLRVLGGSPAAARRALSAWRASKAARIRWLRTASRL